ncbi:MAG: hypothetical protein KDB66_01615 [Solirubrobacterales bacterium]|nr:hypothetical protein [Solirubrobacterales bacterium]MCB8915174.1 hypothetical protein [Thermoleophilales bacterium]
MALSGSGKERGIALGGGGTWFVTWMLSFLTTAKRPGVDLGNAESMIGQLKST